MHSGRDRRPRLKGFARKMRHEATDAERAMWRLLRDKQLAGFKFRRQVPLLGYIADFYCIHERCVVELDGGQHGDDDRRAYDAVRTRKLNEAGIDVLRFSDVDVLKNRVAVVRTIYNHLASGARPSPQPSPGVPGEGAGPSVL